MTQHIKDSLASFLSPQTTPANDDNWNQILIANWASIMGNLSDKVQLEKVQGSTLLLGVYDPSWMQELYLLSAMLIESINKQLPKPYVTGLRFRAATRKRPKTPAKKSAPHQPPKSVSLNTTQRQALEKIEDPQLRLVLYQFLVRCCQ